MKATHVSWIILSAIGMAVALIMLGPTLGEPPLNGCGFLTYPACGLPAG